jgi:hypothetical protein
MVQTREKKRERERERERGREDKKEEGTELPVQQGHDLPPPPPPFLPPLKASETKRKEKREKEGTAGVCMVLPVQMAQFSAKSQAIESVVWFEQRTSPFFLCILLTLVPAYFVCRNSLPSFPSLPLLFATIITPT